MRNLPEAELKTIEVGNYEAIHAISVLRRKASKGFFGLRLMN